MNMTHVRVCISIFNCVSVSEPIGTGGSRSEDCLNWSIVCFTKRRPFRGMNIVENSQLLVKYPIENASQFHWWPNLYTFSCAKCRCSRPVMLTSHKPDTHMRRYRSFGVSPNIPSFAASSSNGDGVQKSWMHSINETTNEYPDIPRGKLFHW